MTASLKISDFANICQLVDSDGMTASVCAKLNELGAQDTEGGPVDEQTISFKLIGYLFYQREGKWLIKNV